MISCNSPLLRFPQPVHFLTWGNVGGAMESRGPLADWFDEWDEDSFFGQSTWEKAESLMQALALQHALQKEGLSTDALDAVLGGDLLNQCVATSFAMRDVPVPLLGLYGACSTMGEALLLGGCLVSGGYYQHVGAAASSHFCAAERQYRTPLPYGSQRSPTAQWTATAAGCCILGSAPGNPRLVCGLPGRVVDLGIRDMTNMGAAMAPAALDTLERLFRATQTTPRDYDRIFTGDLGAVGHRIVSEQLEQDGYAVDGRYTDCGLLLYDREKQDMHAGGSGAGCSAAVLCGYILGQLKRGVWRRVLFAPTGALLSPTMSFQKESIPGICHAVVLES